METLETPLSATKFKYCKSLFIGMGFNFREWLTTPKITSCYYNVAMWLTFNLLDCTAGRQSLLRFLKKPGGDESNPLLPTPQSSAENYIL